jgi:alkylation response protein AidB-like acyl-CoA dehydrogenase
VTATSRQRPADRPSPETSANSQAAPSRETSPSRETPPSPQAAPRPLAREDAVTAVADLVPAIAARAAEYDRDGAFPVADFADLRAAGLLGLMAPKRLGGSGAGFADYAEVAMTLGRGNGATALVFNMHASVTGALALVPDEMLQALDVPEWFFGVRDEILRDAVAGACYAVAMSERRAGSRLSQLATTYEAVEGGWRIVGSKTFCSGAGHAAGYLVAARARDAATSVSQFLVPADLPGIAVEQTWDSLGMRATASNDVHFDTVVPHERLLGGIEGLGVLIAQAMPQWLVASYAAVYVGVARAALEAAVEYATRRGVARLPHVRARIGRADASVSAAEQVIREAARLVDARPGDPDTNRWVWRAKLLAGETAMDVAASMLEACGAGATRRGSALERLYRDARCGSLQPATSDVCADWLGMAALGLDPDADAEVARW